MKKHILPNPHTKKRATFLSQHFLAVYAIMLFFIIQAFSFVPKVAPGVLSYASNISFSDLLTETNKIRGQNNLQSLTVNEQLSKAAYKKAQHMFKYNYWAHVAPDGTEPWFFILNENYDYVYAGENLAKNFNSSRDVVEAWYKSPSHRENLLSPNYDEIGFAVVNGVLEGYQTTLVVQMFGKSKNVAGANSQTQPTSQADPNETAVVPNTQTTNLESQDNTFDFDSTDEKKALNAIFSKGQPNNLEIVEYKPPFTIKDVTSVSHLIGYTFGGFLVGLLALDIWYSRRKTIFKPTGHTLAHIIFLTIIILGILFFTKPGVVL